MFDGLQGVVETVDTGDFVSNVVLNAAIAGTLQFFWSIVKAQQIIILYALFAIMMPANVKSVFSVLLQVASFEMIPTDDIFSKMLERL